MNATPKHAISRYLRETRNSRHGSRERRGWVLLPHASPFLFFSGGNPHGALLRKRKMDESDVNTACDDSICPDVSMAGRSPRPPIAPGMGPASSHSLPPHPISFRDTLRGPQPNERKTFGFNMDRTSEHSTRSAMSYAGRWPRVPRAPGVGPASPHTFHSLLIFFGNNLKGPLLGGIDTGGFHVNAMAERSART